jgi:hypothetical protein
LSSELWETFELGEVCTLTKGSSPTQKTLAGEYPLIVTGPEPLSSEEYQFEGEAVCIPMVSSTGHGHASIKRLHYAQGKFALANIMTGCQVKDPSRCNTRFLYLYLQQYKDERIVSRMRGTANVSLSQRELAKVPLQLPPVYDQNRIVNLVDALDHAIGAAYELVTTLAAAHANLTTSFLGKGSAGSRAVKLGDVISLDLHRSDLVPGRKYPLAGVLNRGRGLLLRDPVTTETTSYTKLTQLLPGQVVFSKLKAFEGAITVAPTGLDERYASSEFPTFACRDSLLPEFFRLRTLQPDFWEQLAQFSKGMGGRRERLSPADFLTLEFWLPPLVEQRKAVELLAAVGQTSGHAAGELSALHDLRTELLASLLSGAHRIPETYDELMGA